MDPQEEYHENGFCVIKGLFCSSEIENLRAVLSIFHERWKKDNINFYNAKAVNSAYITDSKYLDDAQRLSLFRFICSQKILGIAEKIFPNKPAFMNTQLFFNPKDSQQKNYWHRDLQYNPVSVEEQKKLLVDVNVIHFRIPLQPEPGLEIIPGTHTRWDTEEEFSVRNEINGRQRFDNLSSAKHISLDVGDLLVFSANMVHRGLYGLDRFSFDILFCDATRELVQYAKPTCLPDGLLLEAIETPDLFVNTLELMDDFS